MVFQAQSWSTEQERAKDVAARNYAEPGALLVGSLANIPRREGTMTLTDFLLARIAEDEAAAEHVNRGRWNSRVALLDLDLYGHVARQHPKRVLAECDAKRRIVKTCAVYEYEVTNAYGYDDVLAALALPYADHPDYREEWKP